MAPRLLYSCLGGLMSLERLLILSLVLIAACAKQDPLRPLEPLNLASQAVHSAKIDFCTEPAYDQKQYLKTIIILDHSQSNQNNFHMLPDGTGFPSLPLDISTGYASDPLGTFRYGNVITPGTLLNFLSGLPPNDPVDPLKYFALVNFATDVETYPANSSGFTSDIPAFFNRVQTDATSSGGSPADAGATDYLRALQSAEAIIDNDITLATTCAARPVTAPPDAQCPNPGIAVASSYVIVFVSDGAPVISFTLDTTQTPPVVNMTRENATDILALVSTIAGKVTNFRYVTSVNMFTVYYYNPTNNPDLSASSLLASMAKVGNGISYIGQSGQNLDWTQFQIPKKRITFAVSDIFVTNESVNWWNDGVLRIDTDFDGLPDAIETAFGTNPLLASTQNNGIKDLVRYHLANGLCANKNAMGVCLDAFPANIGAACSGITQPGGIWNSSDPNGLNDCEKRLLADTAGINNPDSNGDLIVDWLEFKHGIPFQVGTAPAVNTPNQDGYTVYQKIKYSLPLNVSAQQMVNLQPSRYTSVLTSSTADQNCYQVTVDDLPVIGDDNQVRVDIVMKSDLLQSTYLYHVGKKRFTPGNNTVTFRDWNDPTEQMLTNPALTADTWKNWK